MATKQLTNERKFDLMEKYGHTDAQMRKVLEEIGFKDLDVEIVLAECATNMGYIWSFKLERWFDKSQGMLDEDQEDYDTLLGQIRDEDEHK